MRIKTHGFTLIELMSVLAIAGVLTAIAVPNYQRYQRRARQAEGKVSLGTLYLTEFGVMQDQHSYTGCVITVGGALPGVEYYAAGFSNAVASGNGSSSCAPYGKMTDVVGGSSAATCLAHKYVSVPAGAVVNYQITESCTAGQNANYVQAVSYGAGTGVASETELQGAGTGLTWNFYTAAAAGFLGGTGSSSTALTDMWTIDQDKVIALTNSGI